MTSAQDALPGLEEGRIIHNVRSMESARRMLGSPIPWMVALNVMGVNLIAPVLPAYAAHFGVGFAEVSTLVTGFALARMAFRVQAGTLADRLGSRLICTSGGVVQAGGALLAALAPGFGVLLAARAVQGVGSALFGTSINRYLLVTTDKADLGRATAGFQVGIVVGATAGPLIGGFAAESFGIFAPFYFQAVVAFLLAFVSRSYVRDRGSRGAVGTAAKPPRSARSLLAIHGFKVVMILGFGHFFVRAGAMNVLVPAFADDVLSMSPTQIGAVISLASVASLVIMVIAGHLTDSVGRRPVALAGAFTAASTVALGGLVGTAAGLTVVAALVGIGIGLGAVALPTMIGDIAPPGTEGRASGVYRMANDMGWVIGPITLGLLADSSRYDLAFVVAGIPLLVGGAILLRSRTLRATFDRA